MSTPEAGWYPDPSGDASKLRFWNGSIWTDDYMDASEAANYVVQEQAAAEAPRPEYVAAEGAGVQGSAYNAAYGQPGASASAQPGNAAYGQPGSPAYGQPVYATPMQQVFYRRSEGDTTLLLIAFIFMLVKTVCVAFAVIPLAWAIPMTVRSWGMYKGTKPNTTAFGVCSLLFVSLVGGILMLCAEKDNTAY